MIDPSLYPHPRSLDQIGRDVQELLKQAANMIRASNQHCQQTRDIIQESREPAQVREDHEPETEG